VLLTVPVAALAQPKVNDEIAESIENTPFSTYLLAIVVVLLAAVLLALSMLRRSKR
jgi:hypothetical protein